jgi:Helix-turn-helix domain
MDEAVRYRRALSYARGLDISWMAELVERLSALLDQRRAAPDPAELLTLPEAASIAGLRLGTLHTQLRRGKLAGMKHGRDLYVTRGELARYLAQRDTHRGGYARRLAHTAASETGV